MLENEDVGLEAEENLQYLCTQQSQNNCMEILNVEDWDRERKGKGIVAVSSDYSEEEFAGGDTDDDTRDYDSEDLELTQRIVDFKRKRKGEEEDIFYDSEDECNDAMDSDSDCIFVSEPAEPLSFNKVKKIKKSAAGKGPTDRSHCSELSTTPADFVPSDDDEKFDLLMMELKYCLGCSLLEEGRAGQRR